MSRFHRLLHWLYPNFLMHVHFAIVHQVAAIYHALHAYNERQRKD